VAVLIQIKFRSKEEGVRFAHGLLMALNHQTDRADTQPCGRLKDKERASWEMFREDGK